MSTARGVFIVLWLLIILPLILLNIKKFKIKHEGAAPTLNLIRIVLVAVVGVLFTVFWVIFFNFTVNYQSELTLEKYLYPLAEAVAQGETVDVDGYEFFADLGTKDSKFTAQFGLGILPKYSVGNMPESDDIKMTADNIIYLPVRLRADNKNDDAQIIVARMEMTDNKWKVQKTYLADEKMVDFFINKKFIYDDHVSPWRKLN